MKLEGRIYCEGPDCEASAHVSVSDMQAGRFGLGFVKTTEYGSSGDYEQVFCCWDCVLKHAAKVPAPEIIPFTPLDDEPS